MFRQPLEIQQIRAVKHKRHQWQPMNHVSGPVGDHLELHVLNLAGVDKHRNLQEQPSIPDTFLQLCIRAHAN